MIDNPRYILITSLLALPQTPIEQQWLKDTICSAKESALNALEDLEKENYSSFNSETEENKFDSINHLYDYIEKEKNIFEYWLAIENELYVLIGNEDKFLDIESELRNSECHMQAESLFLKKIVDNLLYHVSHKTDLVEKACKGLAIAQKNAKEYKIKNNSEIDDEWYILQIELKYAEEHLERIDAILPLCWISLRYLAMSSLLERYVSVKLLELIEQNDCDGFVFDHLKEQKKLQEAISAEKKYEWEDDGFSCWSDSNLSDKFSEKNIVDRNEEESHNWDEDIPSDDEDSIIPSSIICENNLVFRNGNIEKIRRTDFLNPINDISYLCERAALNHTGELKSELSNLCAMIRNKSKGYDAEEIQSELKILESALDNYRSGNKEQGAMFLTGVSRIWWKKAGF